MSRKRRQIGKTQRRQRSGPTPPSPATKLTAELLATMAQPNGFADPAAAATQIAGDGPSRARDAVVIDATNMLLMESVDVSLVGGFKDGQHIDMRLFMQMGGRVNKTQRRTTVGVSFGADGAAAIISELLALADRAGGTLLADLTERLVALQHNNHAELRYLRAALDAAIADTDPGTTA